MVRNIDFPPSNKKGSDEQVNLPSVPATQIESSKNSLSPSDNVLEDWMELSAQLQNETDDSKRVELLKKIALAETTLNDANYGPDIEFSNDIPNVTPQKGHIPTDEEIATLRTFGHTPKSFAEMANATPRPTVRINEKKEWNDKWRGTLRQLIEGATNVKERVERSTAYIAQRIKEFDLATAEKSEQLFAKMGDAYNKLPMWEKIALGSSLAMGYGLTIPLSGVLSGVYALGLVGTRFAAMAGTFRKNEEMLKRIQQGKSEGLLENTSLYTWLGSGSETVLKNKAMAKALVTSFGLTAGMAWASHEIAEHHVGERIGQWISEYLSGSDADKVVEIPKHVRHGVPSTSQHVETPHVASAHASEASASGTDGDLSVQTGNAAAAVSATHGAESVVAQVEAPTIDIRVDATKGHGYEYMMKRVWEQLQDKKLDAKNFGEDTDMHKLLTADKSTIDKVVHQIAMDKEHAFYNANGTSIRIDPTAHMTVGSDNQLYLSDDAHTDGIVKAVDDMRVTPAYHPETVATNGAETPAVTARTGELFFGDPANQKNLASIPPPPPNADIPTVRASGAPVEVRTGSGGYLVDTDGRHVQSGDYSQVDAVQSPAPVETATPHPVSPAVESAPQPTREKVSANVSDTQSPTLAIEKGIVINQFDVRVPVAEPHIYADVDALHLFAHGGSPVERGRAILDYLTKNPNQTIFSADDSGKYRVPWTLSSEGKAIPGEPIRTAGLFGFFSTFMDAPKPDEFAKIIK